MTAEELRNRTKDFALRVIKLFRALPKTEEARIIGRQLLRSASSVAANYRAACRGRSKREFFSKLSITLEEADESLFWIEIIIESGIMPKHKMDSLYNEALEILKIISKSHKTAKSQDR